MSETIRQRAQRVFLEVADMSEAERDAALDRACAGNAVLRTEVEALLRTDARSEGLMGLPTVAVSAIADAATAAAPIREGPGTPIGPYKLLQLIGEGGFGSVFMAEQEKPVQRKVALKIIKLGMDTHQVVARFEQERQALAILDHPNIAKVFDAGATATGRPFFVMELCTGEPIDDYCDRHSLTIPERLRLFVQVCTAVQHAHTKGIIHRDLKPGNVLVSAQDGNPSVKVIDFGIAKATASKLTEKTLFTEHRQIIGTPEYMSPEQAEGSLDIDTRTDIYALGVMLYELLTGSTPFSSRELRSAAYAEIQRIIREVEPPKPSTRVSTLGETLASTAAHRRTEPTRLSRVIRGDLDWIVMKALEKDRTRRYETANGLAADVQRHLTGEPVVAAPPSSAYRMRKFVKRNRVPVLAAGAVAAALLTGVVAFAWQASVASEQRDIAVKARDAEAEQRKLADAARTDAQAQQARAEAQEAEAKKQAAIAEAVATFQTDMLAAVDPNNLPKDPVTKEPLKDAVTVLQAMQAAVEVLDEGSLKDQPLVEASVRNTIGNTLLALARYEEAEPNLRKALTLRRAALPAGHLKIANSLNNLASLLHDQNKLAEAEPLYREALQIRRSDLPAGHQGIATALNNLASLLFAQNKLAEAEPLCREALQTRRAALPAGHPAIADSLNILAAVLFSQNKLAEAEPLYREALQIERAALPAGHPNIANSLNSLAALLQEQNRLAEAEPLYREALRIRRSALPAGHPDIASALNNLALLLKSRNELAEAEPLFREALQCSRAALPAGHPDIANSLNNLASLLYEQDKFAEAEPLLREALQIYRAASPGGHPDIGDSLSWLASILAAQGKISEAERHYHEALEIRRAAYPVGHPLIANALNNLAKFHWQQGKLDQSIPMFEEVLALQEAARGRQHPATLMAVANLGVNYKDAGRLAEAIPLLEEVYRASKQDPTVARIWSEARPLLDAYARTADPAKPESVASAMTLARELVADARAKLPKDSPELAAQLATLSLTLLKLNAWDEAEPLMRECLAIREQTQPDAWTTFNTRSMLGGVLLGQNRLAEAEPLLLKGYQGMKDREAAIPPQAKVLRIPEALERLVALCEAWDKAEPGKGYDAKAEEWRIKLLAAKSVQGEPDAQ